MGLITTGGMKDGNAYLGTSIAFDGVRNWVVVKCCVVVVIVIVVAVALGLIMPVSSIIPPENFK